MSWSTQSHHLNEQWLAEVTYQVLWISDHWFHRRFFAGFLPYMGMAAILVMWPASWQLIFISMYLKAYIKNLVKNGSVVSEKSKFWFSYINDLGPRSRNDLDLQYSQTYINPISCLNLSTFSSQAAIVLKNPLFSLFPIQKPKFQNLTLLLSRSRSTQVHHLYKTMMGWSPGSYIPSFMESSPLVPEKKNFEGFVPYMGCGGHLGLVT